MAVGSEVEMIVNERRVEADEEERLCMGVVRMRERWYCSVQLSLTDHANGIAGDGVVPAGSDAVVYVDLVAVDVVSGRVAAVVEESGKTAVDKPNVPKDVGSQLMADEET